MQEQEQKQEKRKMTVTSGISAEGVLMTDGKGGYYRRQLTREEVEWLAKEMNRRCREMVDELVLSGPGFYVQPLTAEGEVIDL